MRISGTYWDRLYMKVLPVTGILLLFAVFMISDKLQVVFSFLCLSLLMWILDIISINSKYKNLQALHIADGAIRIGTEWITPENVEQINPFQIMQGRIAVEVLEFRLTNGRCFRVLDKPVNIWTVTSIKPSKALLILVEKFPELSNKIEKTQIK